MLELQGVTAGYGRTMVLADVSLHVPSSGAVAVMGHNGAGKTTLLRVAVGLVPVKSGSVLLDGEDVTTLRPSDRVRRGLGYVPQGQQSFPHMTTLENLQLITTARTAIETGSMRAATAASWSPTGKTCEAGTRSRSCRAPSRCTPIRLMLVHALFRPMRQG